MKYTIELVCRKGNTFREFDGTAKEVRAYAKNLLIKRGKMEWDAIIYKNKSGQLTLVGKILYDEKWRYITENGWYTVGDDGSINVTRW